MIEQVLEMLPTSIVTETARTVPGTGGSKVIRGDRGQNYAEFHHHALAEFTLQAVGHLQAFLIYTEQLERSAFNDRDRRREAEKRLDEVRNELLAADSFGPMTKDGQRRVKSAIASVRDNRHRGDN